MKSHPSILRDFTVDRRVGLLSVVALLVGTGAAALAVFLLRGIALATNLFYYHRFGSAPVSPAGSPLGPWMPFVPVLGGMIVGLMAHYGSDKIRGHGIPEAIESILLGGVRVDPRIAVLKPLSAAISIGSGGPFGAEGPIIMTGGAFGSLIAQGMRLTDAERTTLSVAGASAGMSATFAAPLAATLLAVELLLFELRPPSLVPVALASAIAAVLRVYWLGPGPLFVASAGPGVQDGSTMLTAVGIGLLVGVASAALSRTMYSFGDTQLPESRLPQSHLPETGLPKIYAFADETCRGVAETMATSGVSAMPVVDRSTKALCGHVTVQDLLAGRRRSVQREQGRVRVFGSAALTYKK